jgi:hypothetical protein
VAFRQDREKVPPYMAGACRKENVESDVYQDGLSAKAHARLSVYVPGAAEADIPIEVFGQLPMTIKRTL